MVFVFFDDEGVIYTHYAQIGTKVTGMYIVDVMSKFLKAMKKKRADMVASGEWLLHWDNAAVHKAKVATEYLSKRGS